jgi:DNA repair protein RecN (Recombination protein N)
MLQQLDIQHFAIIQALSLRFEQGLTIITGETGAGKSLILDSVQWVMGGKITLKPSSNTTQVTATWQLTPALQQALGNLGLPSANPTVICRQRSNKVNKTWVNDTPVDKAAIQALSQCLMDVQAQHELTDLFLPRYQLQCVDQLADKGTFGPLLLSYQQVFDQWQQAQVDLTTFTQQWQLQRHALQVWQTQLAEIAQAQLTHPDEDIQLKTQLERLTHQQQLQECLSETADRLSNPMQPDLPGIVQHCQALTRLITTASQWDDSLTPLAPKLQQLLIEAQDMAHTVAHHAKGVVMDADTLDAMSTRYSQLERLKRKTGKTLAALIDWQQELATAVESYSDPEGHIILLQHAVDQHFAHACLLADQLTLTRQQLADTLEASLNHTLHQLAMPHARLSIQLGKQALGRLGQDGVTFLFSANQGHPLRPLAKVASGGELSRVLFALKCQLASALDLSLLVFDEMDTGMSGEAVSYLAQAMANLSRQVPVLAVTHQPIVAAMGDAHWHIAKHTVDTTHPDATHTQVTAELLDHKEKRLNVLSRLASGIDTDDKTVEAFINRLLHHAVSWKSLSTPG